jgi:ankyrin repeat protein
MEMKPNAAMIGSMAKFLSLFIILLGMLVPQFSAANSLNESLIYYVYFGTARDVEQVLRLGADPNTVDKHQWPALAIASDRKSPESTPIAIALIRAGADMNRAHLNSYPIHNAIKNGNEKLVFFLLKRGVNLNVRDPQGLDPFQLAHISKNPQIKYYFSKLRFEEAQAKTFLKSKVHLWQRLKRFTYHNCAYQYWSFYVKSGQDKEIDIFKLQRDIAEHARKARVAGGHLLTHFRQMNRDRILGMTAQTRRTIYDELNSMVSNQYRSKHGVGKPADMEKRCGVIVENVRKGFGL